MFTWVDILSYGLEKPPGFETDIVYLQSHCSTLQYNTCYRVIDHPTSDQTNRTIDRATFKTTDNDRPTNQQTDQPNDRSTNRPDRSTVRPTVRPTDRHTDTYSPPDIPNTGGMEAWVGISMPPIDSSDPPDPNSKHVDVELKNRISQNNTYKQCQHPSNHYSVNKEHRFIWTINIPKTTVGYRAAPAGITDLQKSPVQSSSGHVLDNNINYTHTRLI